MRPPAGRLGGGSAQEKAAEIATRIIVNPRHFYRVLTYRVQRFDLRSDRGHEIDDPLADLWIPDTDECHVQCKPSAVAKKSAT